MAPGISTAFTAVPSSSYENSEKKAEILENNAESLSLYKKGGRAEESKGRGATQRYVQS